MNARLVAIGISESHASLIANRKRRPSLELAVVIERELGIPPSYWVVEVPKTPTEPASVPDDVQ